jgi:hypothetical protein
LQQWIPDEDDSDEDGETASNDNILDCHLPKPPTADQTVDFRKMCTKRSDLLTSWSTTPVGETLANTTFVVAVRHHATED